MASTIYCDAEGCESGADQLIGTIATGDQLALCNEHFVGFCIAMADKAREEVEAEVNGPAPDPGANGSAPGDADAEGPAPKSDADEATEAEEDADEAVAEAAAASDD